MSSLQEVVTRDKPMRDPIPDPPIPGTFYRQFRRQLAASEHALTIGQLLMNAVYLLEGWPLPAQPWNREQRHEFTQHACYAIRACSDVEVQTAIGKAERFAVDRYLDLRQDMLRILSPEEKERILRKFARDIVYEFQFCLKYGADVLSAADEATRDRLLLSGEERDDDPRRI